MPSPWSDLDRPPLSAARLNRALVGAGRWREVRVVEETGSTNADVAAAARAGAADGLVVLAERQTGGRGRLDRRWQSPPRAAILVSALIRPTPPPSTWPLVPLLAGLAVAEAVRAVAGVPVELKWPNDVIVVRRDAGGDVAGEGKLAGVLVERVDTALVVGIGLNVSTRTDELPVPTATSVLAAGGLADRESLAKELLRALDRRLTVWSAADGAPAAVLPAYREICATIGRQVRVDLPGGVQMLARAQTVDDGGRLLLRRDDDTTVALSAGDVVHVRAVG